MKPDDVFEWTVNDEADAHDPPALGPTPQVSHRVGRWRAAADALIFRRVTGVIALTAAVLVGASWWATREQELARLTAFEQAVRTIDGVFVNGELDQLETRVPVEDGQTGLWPALVAAQAIRAQPALPILDPGYRLAVPAEVLTTTVDEAGATWAWVRRVYTSTQAVDQREMAFVSHERYERDGRGDWLRVDPLVEPTQAVSTTAGSGRVTWLHEPADSEAVNRLAPQVAGQLDSLCAASAVCDPEVTFTIRLDRSSETSGAMVGRAHLAWFTPGTGLTLFDRFTQLNGPILDPLGTDIIAHPPLWVTGQPADAAAERAVSRQLTLDLWARILSQADRPDTGLGQAYLFALGQRTAVAAGLDDRTLRTLRAPGLDDPDALWQKTTLTALDMASAFGILNAVLAGQPPEAERSLWGSFPDATGARSWLGGTLDLEAEALQDAWASGNVRPDFRLVVPESLAACGPQDVYAWDISFGASLSGLRGPGEAPTGLIGLIEPRLPGPFERAWQSPIWSPDGHRALLQYGSSYWVVADVGAGTLIWLPPNPPGEFVMASWLSPTQVVLSAWVNGSGPVTVYDLTPAGVQMQDFAGLTSGDLSTYWPSPRGRWGLFASHGDGALMTDVGSSLGLEVLDLTTGGRQALGLPAALSPTEPVIQFNPIGFAPSGEFDAVLQTSAGWTILRIDLRPDQAQPYVRILARRRGATQFGVIHAVALDRQRERLAVVSTAAGTSVLRVYTLPDLLTPTLTSGPLPVTSVSAVAFGVDGRFVFGDGRTAADVSPDMVTSVAVDLTSGAIRTTTDLGALLPNGPNRIGVSMPPVEITAYRGVFGLDWFAESGAVASLRHWDGRGEPTPVVYPGCP